MGRLFHQILFSRGEPCTWLGLLLAGRCQAVLPTGKTELRLGEHLPGEPLAAVGCFSIKNHPIGL